MTSFDQQLSGHRCRLLLPTGKYVIAEVHRPGAYRRYSTPVDRAVGGVGGVGGVIAPLQASAAGVCFLLISVVL